MGLPAARRLVRVARKVGAPGGRRHLGFKRWQGAKLKDNLVVAMGKALAEYTNHGVGPTMCRTQS